MIEKLNHWVLTERHIAFDDLESKTAIEMVSRIYGKMNELVESYNEFVSKIDITVEEFTTGVITRQDEFECKITKIVHEYIEYLDKKVVDVNAQIEEIITNADTRIDAGLSELLNDGQTRITEFIETTTADLLARFNSYVAEKDSELATKFEGYVTEANASVNATMTAYQTTINGKIAEFEEILESQGNTIDEINGYIQEVNEQLKNVDGRVIEFVYHEDTRELNLSIDNQEIIVEGGI